MILEFNQEWTWIEMNGPDSGDFLHRLSTIDIRKMKPGMGAEGFFLNPQGKIEASFWVWCLEEARFAFEIDPGKNGKWKENLLKWIDQFHFAEKFQIQEMTEIGTRWIFPGPDSMPDVLREMNPGSIRYFSDTEIRVCHHGDRPFGRPWISIWGRTDWLNTWILDHFAVAETSSIDPNQLALWRVLAIQPAVEHEITHQVNPLEIGRRSGIADNKGCYPGQEVIEKIISLGSPAKRLALIQGAESLESLQGTPVSAQDKPDAGPREIGVITSASALAEAGNFYALALMKKTHAKEGLEVVTSNGKSARIIQVANP